jgi:L-alanine-DL-glutamate epimerase-like enolase superfamily enzyme
MKITNYKVSIISIPFEKKIFSSTIVLKGYDFIIITLQTDEGIEGLGYIVTPGYGTSSIYSIVKDVLCPMLIGKDPFYVEYIWEYMLENTKFFGQKGGIAFGIAGIDMCIWDIIGKVCEQPLFKILGAYSDSIPVYASGGWLSYSIEELTKEMAGYIKEGYDAIKMKIGFQDPEEDYRRISAVRKVVGEKVRIMVDANQRWSASEAIQIGKRLQDLGVVWFEEPVSTDDIESYIEVTKKLDLSVAAGESVYTLRDFRNIITNHCVDVIQINYFRAGGITEWRKIAALAKAWHLPISSQSNMEIQVHLMASIPNISIMENHMVLRKYTERIFEQLPKVKNNSIKPPDVPGIGLDLFPEIKKRHESFN